MKHRRTKKDRRPVSRTVRRVLGLLALCGILLSFLLPRTTASTDRDATTGVGSDGAIAAILPIHGVITDVMADGLQRRIDAALQKGAGVLVFELDTPGGLVSSSIDIADMIRKVRGAKTVAWVNPNAISGGSVVAVAAEEIVMARSARMGDSQVIMGGPEGVQAVPKELQPKAYTVVLGEFKASALLRGYSPVLTEAFVIPEREVWWLENTKTGEKEFVFRDEKLRRLGDGSSSSPSAPTTDAGEPEWKLVTLYYDVVSEKDQKVIQPIERDDQLLLVSAAEAVAYGFSKGIVENDQDLKTRYALSEVIRFDPSWSEAMATWLTSDYVRGFLMVVIMLAGYVEFHTPGLGLAGLVALIALAVFVGAPYLTGVADVWEILAIVCGIILIAIEVIIPGFGVAGISGLVLLVLGILGTFAPPEPGHSFPLYLPTMQQTITGVKNGLMMLVAAMVVSLTGMVMISRYLTRLPVLRNVIPANPTSAEVMVEDPYQGTIQFGDVGEVVATLRPAGKVRFGEALVDVVTEGEYVEWGTKVVVVEQRGNRVVVRPVG
ncbi:MAG: NfeD family protein [Planctomycetota bacterium]